MHWEVYSGVMRLPEELNSASRRRPRAWGAGPRSVRSWAVLWGSLGDSDSLSERDLRSVGGWGGVMRVECWVIVVVAETEPGGFRRWVIGKLADLVIEGGGVGTEPGIG